MTLRSLRGRLERTLDAMALPEPLTVERLCASLSTTRQRPLTMLAMPLPSGGPCGLWVATGTADYIVYEATTSPTHRTHIVLHELAHVLLEHSSTKVLTDDATSALMPHLEPATVQRLMARTWFDEDAEREAEVAADILSKRIQRPLRGAGQAPPSEVADVVDRLRRSLERR
ncbi:hypothetical protein AB0M46_25185 [Dactylosporangium sp. NPDC051485]|uniref:hypothetical protein n=1 Tax=Dactylosporangium sp. NPDC051485 TaxID=3154846 RepID=UPI0034456E00